MDAFQFDRATTLLNTATGRRRTVRGLGAVVLAFVAPRLGGGPVPGPVQEAAARKHHKKHGHGHHHPQPPQSPVSCPVDRPLCPQVSTTECCAPPAGVKASKVYCGAEGTPAVPVCLCDLDTGDICPGECRGGDVHTLNCARIDAGMIAAICQAAGCTA